MDLKTIRKLFITAVLSVILIAVSDLPLKAEAVFLKDGSIINGTIVTDAASSITIRTADKKTRQIPRGDIMRILYAELYMGKVYVRLTTGEVVEGYQVDEDRDIYTFRKDISKPAEFTISKKKVMFISRTNPTDLIGIGSIDKIVLKWSPPFKPAKLYKVYMRENRKGEQFKIIGETDDVTYTMKKLSRNTAYEAYVTAIGDAGEESLPSEKIITQTVPYSPEGLSIKEKYSDDGKTVTLTLSWKPVDDQVSRVKSYSVYRFDDGERKKIGNVTGAEYVVKDFPAEGRHWFAVVSVNEFGAESEDIKAVYDAGYKIYTSVSATYLVPFGDLGVIADKGYGGLVDFSIGLKSFSAGFETGYLTFSTAVDDMETMAIIPVLAFADYRFPLFASVTLRPLLKAGAGYNMVEYIKHDNPYKPETYSKNEFNPMASGGLFLDYEITEKFKIFGGAEYSVIFQDSGRMSFMGCSFGAGYIF